MPRRDARLTVPLLAAVLLCVAPADRASAGGWHSDFSAAKAEAIRLDCPLLIHFYADYCGPCKRLDREVLHSPALTGQLGHELVGVKVDTQQAGDLVQQYGISSIPADVFLTPRGRVLGMMNGYRPPDDYLKRVAAVEQQYTRLRSMSVGYQGGEAPVGGGPRLPAQSPTAPAGGGSAPSAAPSTGTGAATGLRVRPRSDGTLLVGLRGYSPVTLYRERRWLAGEAEFAWEHQGLTYLMTSAAEREVFAETPEKYAPRLLGCDPVLYFDEQRAVPGSTRFAAFYEDNLFLFASPASRATFREQPDRYARRRTVLLIEEIETRS